MRGRRKMGKRRELRAEVIRHHEITNYGLEKRWLGQRGGIFHQVDIFYWQGGIIDGWSLEGGRTRCLCGRNVSWENVDS